MMNGHDFAVALRQVAEFYEQYPDIQVPCVGDFNVFVQSRAELIELARRLEHVEKRAIGNWYYLVVGTRVVPERVEEIVEWDCHQIFGVADGPPATAESAA